MPHDTMDTTTSSREGSHHCSTRQEFVMWSNGLHKMSLPHAIAQAQLQ